MKVVLKFFLILISVLWQVDQSFAVLPYVPSELGTPACPRGTVTYSPRFLWKGSSLHQGDTKSCHLHAAYQLILRDIAPQIPGNDLALWDLFGKSCDKEMGRLDESGTELPILFNLGGKTVRVGNSLHVEDVAGFDSIIRRKQPCATDQRNHCCKTTGLFLDHFFRNQVHNVEAIVDQFVDRPNTFVYEVLNTVNLSPSVQLPPFNVHVHETDPSRDSISSINSKIAQLVINGELGGIARPVGITVTVDSERHASVVGGTRSICCDGSVQNQCTLEFYLNDSVVQSGWYKADPISENSLAHRQRLTWVKPCRMAGDDASSSSALPLCEQEVIGDYPLHYAIETGNLTTFNYSLNAHPDLLNQKLGDSAPIHVAVSMNRPDMVRALVNAHADLNTRTRFDLTAFHIAVAENNFEIVKILLAAGADLGARDINRSNIVHKAVAIGNPLVLQTILASEKMNPRLLAETDILGRTPIQLALNEKNPEILQVLARHGVTLGISEQVRSESRDNRSLEENLRLTTLSDRSEVQKSSSSSQAAVRTSTDMASSDPRSDNKGNTLLHRSVSEGDLVTVQNLLSSVDLNIQNYAGLTPLDILVDKGNIPGITLL